MPLGDLHPDVAPPTAVAEGTEYEALLGISIEEIWNSLTPQEEVVLGHAGDPPTGWAQSLGLRPNEASVVAARV